MRNYLLFCFFFLPPSAKQSDADLFLALPRRLRLFDVINQLLVGHNYSTVSSNFSGYSKTFFTAFRKIAKSSKL